MSKKWKIGLPMYLVSEQAKYDYLLFLKYFIIEIKKLGFSEEIEIIQDYPKNLYTWWLDEQLLFSQTCGYPLIHTLKEQVHVIATPCYDVLGCEKKQYSSIFIKNKNNNIESLQQAKDQIAVINQIDSNSGMNVFRAEIAEWIEPNTHFFKTIRVSGSHLNSLQYVANHQADFAAIDCVTFAYINKYQPELLANIDIIAYSKKTPALPFIASKKLSKKQQDLVFKTLKNIQNFYPELCKTLFIKDIQKTQLNDYLIIQTLEDIALSKPYYEFSF